MSELTGKDVFEVVGWIGIPLVVVAIATATSAWQARKASQRARLARMGAVYPRLCKALIDLERISTAGGSRTSALTFVNIATQVVLTREGSALAEDQHTKAQALFRDLDSLLCEPGTGAVSSSVDRVLNRLRKMVFWATESFDAPPNTTLCHAGDDPPDDLGFDELKDMRYQIERLLYL